MVRCRIEEERESKRKSYKHFIVSSGSLNPLTSNGLDWQLNQTYIQNHGDDASANA